MGEVTKEIPDEVPWCRCMMFTDDIVFLGENLKEVNYKIYQYRFQKITFIFKFSVNF